MPKINVALIGVGNFSKALLEGVSFYTQHPGDSAGLMHPKIGEYSVADINFVAAFDIDERKVGKLLHEAIYSPPNVSKQITEPLKYEAIVHRGPTLDGVGKHMLGTFVQESSQPVADLAKILKDSQAEVVVNLVPSGSHEATHAYAKAALEAGASFVNCVPGSLAADEKWQQLFQERGLALIGDDLKSQLGATMLNRIILEFMKMRGVRIVSSSQENKGGNTDHFNLQTRSEEKEKSKREALSTFLDENDAKPSVKFVYTGTPSGHKTVTLDIEGEIFGRTPISVHAVIEDEISINGAGVAVDAIRIAKHLVDTKRVGEAWKACPFLMKSPPKTTSDSKAYELFQEIAN